MTTVQIACPTCQARIRAPEAAIGRTIRCPQCRSPFTAEDMAAPARPSRPRADTPATNAFAFDDDPGPLAAAAASPPAGAFALDSISGPVEVVPPPTLTAPPPPVPSPRPAGPGLFDYLAFRRLLAPTLLVWLHYLGVAGLLLGGLLTTFSLIASAVVAGVEGPLAAALLVIWIVGVFVGTLASLVFWRVGCEVLLVLFRIHEVLAAANARATADE